MTEDDLKVMRDEIARAIKETVNGKIDAMRAEIKEHNLKHERDMDEMKPYMQIAAGGKLVYSALKLLAGIAVSYVAIKTALPSFQIHF